MAKNALWINNMLCRMKWGEGMSELYQLIGSVVGTLGGILITNRLTNYRIEQLEKKVDKHNSVIHRTYQLEQTAAVLAERLDVANHRIEDLEKGAG